MREVEAVSRMRPAVNFQNERVLLRGIEIGRLLNPALNLPPVEARVPDLFGGCEVELREEFVVDLRQLRQLARGRVEQEEVTDVDRRRDQQNHLRGVWRRRIRLDFMIAGRDRFDLARRGVNALQIGAPVFGYIDVDVSSVFAPNRAV